MVCQGCSVSCPDDCSFGDTFQGARLTSRTLGVDKQVSSGEAEKLLVGSSSILREDEGRNVQRPSLPLKATAILRLEVEVVGRAPFDSGHRLQTAVVENVGGFARPGRNGTGTGTDQYCGIALRLEFVFYIEDIAQALSRGSIQGALELDDVEVVGLEISQVG